MLKKTEGSRKRGRQNMRWINSIKEAIGMCLHELSRAVEDRTRWLSLIHPWWSGVGADSMANNTNLLTIKKFQTESRFWKTWPYLSP